MKGYTSEQLRTMCANGESKTDWARVDAIPNDEIDDSDVPEDFWDNAVVIYPVPKKPISFRVEEDLVRWYREEAEKKHLRGYQSLMHAVLLSYKTEQEKHSGQ